MEHADPPLAPCRALGCRLKVQGRHEVAPAGDVEIVNQMMVALRRHTFHRAVSPRKETHTSFHHLDKRLEMIYRKLISN